MKSRRGDCPFCYQRSLSIGANRMLQPPTVARPVWECRTCRKAWTHKPTRESFCSEEDVAMRRLLPIHMATEKVRRSFPDNPPNYGGAFTMLGVRCNGTQEPTTVVDAQRDITGFRNRVRRHVDFMAKALTRLDALVDRADNAMRDLVTCPQCKGTKGSGDSGHGTWTDCSLCSGAGMVPNDGAPSDGT